MTSHIYHSFYCMCELLRCLRPNQSPNNKQSQRQCRERCLASVIMCWQYSAFAEMKPVCTKQCYVLEDRFAVLTHQLKDPATCIDIQTCGKPSATFLHKQTKMQGGNRSQHPLSLIIGAASPHPEWSHFKSSYMQLWGVLLDFPSRPF